jgi:putative Holliday junction resolvase
VIFTCQSPFQRFLGFDFGTRRIGMAFGQRITGTAQALRVVANHNSGPEWISIETAIREWLPDAFIIGLPLTLEGHEQAIVQTARRFAHELSNRYALPVFEQDERLSSIEAARRFALARQNQQRRQHDANKLDSIAAQVILENFLATYPNPSVHESP